MKLGYTLDKLSNEPKNIKNRNEEIMGILMTLKTLI